MHQSAHFGVLTHEIERLRGLTNEFVYVTAAIVDLGIVPTLQRLMSSRHFIKVMTAAGWAR